MKYSGGPGIKDRDMSKKDPVDDYFEAKKTAGQRRVEDDHALVAQWQQGHAANAVDPNVTHQVLQRFQPTIQGAIRKYKSPLTGPGLDTQAKNLTIEAMKTFDPTRGAVFNTHLTNTLKRLHRENLQRQGAYVPEAQAFYFGPAQQAHDELLDELGRPPSAVEHEQRLNEMLPEHKRLAPGGLASVLELKRNTVVSSNFEGQPSTFATDIERQNVDLLRYDLDPKEQQVYDLIYKDGVTSTGEMAQRLGTSDPAVSRLKGRIEHKALNPPKPSAFGALPQRKRPG